MKRSLIMPLVLKDWYLQRGTLKVLSIGGLASIAMQLMGGTIAVFGLIATFVCTVILGISLSQTTVMSEKNKQTEPFVMSLPITPLEYAAAKVLSNVSMFMTIWLALMIVLFSTFLTRGLPGLVPPATVAAFTFFVGFCIMLCVGIVARSEKLWNLTMTLVNFAYGGLWLAMSHIPNLAQQAFGPAPVWSKEILLFLGAEFLVLVVVLALGAYGQSRRASFL